MYFHLIARNYHQELNVSAAISLKEALTEIQAVYQQDAELKIVPCHCDQTLESLQHDGHP
jgi:hypothetical protein